MLERRGAMEELRAAAAATGREDQAAGLEPVIDADDRFKEEGETWMKSFFEQFGLSSLQEVSDTKNLELLQSLMQQGLQ
jgi:hypothetical protein